MARIDHNNENLLMHKLNNGRRTNLYEWLENICENFYEEQAVEERKSLDEIKQIFYNNFHESFFVTIMTLLFKFFIEKKSVT